MSPRVHGYQSRVLALRLQAACGAPGDRSCRRDSPGATTASDMGPLAGLVWGAQAVSGSLSRETSEIPSSYVHSDHGLLWELCSSRDLSAFVRVTLEVDSQPRGPYSFIVLEPFSCQDWCFPSEASRQGPAIPE